MAAANLSFALQNGKITTNRDSNGSAIPGVERRLILENFQSPGDIVMLTAAVRDLHLAYPGRFATDVRTSCPALWENNPYITPLSSDAPDVERLACHYPLIHRSNYAPYHFIQGFMQYLSEQLAVEILPTRFAGDIHLSARERGWMSQVAECTGLDLPFWIIVAGGKFDYTTKWWPTSRFQEVVDHFAGRIVFVQAGDPKHHHPPLRGVVNLVGKTGTRQFVRLVYHAQGVVTPVSFAMHLAAGVAQKRTPPKNRPCVVIAGGREPPHWEAYPHHQFVHTVGALACCDDGGCWKARVVPLGDGSEKDLRQNLCVDVVTNNLPRCMDMISAAEICARIERYFDGGVTQYLSASERAVVQRVLVP